MNSLLNNPETTNLIQGIKPYLGKQGSSLADAMMTLMDFANSSIGRDVVGNIVQLASSANPKGKSFTLQTAEGPVNISLNLPFVMFLVFVLLMFSGDKNF